MDYQLRPPESQDLEQVLGLIAICQADPASRCLHVDQSPAGILADMQDLDQPWEDAFRLVWAGSELVGVLGSDLDLEAGRAWLHGPFSRSDDWQKIFGLLFEDLWTRLPVGISRVSNYLEQSFVRGLNFHSDWGFVAKGVSHILQATPQSTHRPHEIQPFLPSDTEMLCQLHALAFPASWLSGPAMIAQADETHPILIAWLNGQRVGYIRLSQHIELPEGQIDFLAVEPAWRGQGLGKKLLQAGLDWVFTQRKLKQAFLNVSATNTAALALYLNLGFALSQSGVALDWWRSESYANR
jgi:ribosomal protein S18 acetylase RimI-like enzyme